MSARSGALRRRRDVSDLGSDQLLLTPECEEEKKRTPDPPLHCGLLLCHHGALITAILYTQIFSFKSACHTSLYSTNRLGLQTGGFITTSPETRSRAHRPNKVQSSSTAGMKNIPQHLFPAWSGPGGGRVWSWPLCISWEAGEGVQSWGVASAVWCLLCHGGRQKLEQVCERGRVALQLPKTMLQLQMPPVFNIYQIPKVYWEDGIIYGYRHPQSSALDCILSSFQMTNETVNIWTHFLPTWYFLWRFCLLFSTVDFLSDSYTWPLLVYMLLICLYPFTSSCAHTFSTMSLAAKHICYFFDYGALSLYSLGCAIAYASYVMPECWVNSPLHRYFVPIAIANTIFCTSLSCYSRFIELQFPQRSKVLRTGAFVVPFIFDNILLSYRLFLCFVGNCSHTDAVSSHCYHLLFAFLTCFLFTSHLPERLAPGRFDYIGQSHQLFHICAVVGTHLQLEAILVDMTSRRSWLSAHSATPSFMGTLGALTIAVLLNLGVIAMFSASLLRAPNLSPEKGDPTNHTPPPPPSTAVKHE